MIMSFDIIKLHCWWSDMVMTGRSWKMTYYKWKPSLLLDREARKPDSERREKTLVFRVEFNSL